MKRMKLKMKKGMARLLTAIMVIGLLPMMPGNMATVHAAEPSTTAYATKEELKNWDYQNQVGKIIFGKDSSGNPMEWYILGNDSGVSGDNTAIFAASPIATNVQFETDSQNNKTFDTWDSYYGVYEGSVPTEVYPNHYGASDLRAELNKMLDDNTYFTEGEKSLLQATTVTTTDKMNSASYTTTDKLYALHGDYYNNDEILYAGSDNGKALVMSTYWNDSSADWFWLRLPFDFDDDVIVVNPGDRVYIINVDYDRAVQPASNLNLSSVIFASAAPAASSDTVVAGTIQTGTAMTLRLDGSNMNIGNVIYDSAQGEQIFVKKSADATGTVSLVVQGKDGSNDWYYSKPVTGAEIIRMNDIKTALNLSDISVDECEIWLETTEDKMAYAKTMTNGTYTCVNKVEVEVNTPTPGVALDSDVTIKSDGVVSATPEIKWTVGTSDATGTAEYDTAYIVTMNFITTDSAYFDDTLTATVNGEPATITKNTDGTATVSYTFPAIEKDKLISIIQPQPLTVANKTAYEDMNLPDTVAIETDKGNVTSAAVTWNTVAPIGGSYDPTILTEQTVILKGTVTCPDGVDANGVTLETKILITISAAGVTGAPVPNPVAGTYTENQTVSLSTTTEGATIYYTTDGTEPSKTNGTVYTTPISITGTKGQSVTVTIKAIAVKDGMQDSEVQVFTYTINLPSDEVTPPDDPKPEDPTPNPVAPVPNPVAGTYTENQTVSLSTTTEGATIYYTTDGTEPSKTNGTVYTTPISITGTKGQSVTVTIKAIAVKDGMQDSEVQVFTYTINLPADEVTPPDDPKPEDPTPNPGDDDSKSEDTTPQPNDGATTEDSTKMEDAKDEVPKTGDASSPMIPFMLMLASASCCMLLLMINGRMGKKHEKNKSEQ